MLKLSGAGETGVIAPTGVAPGPVELASAAVSCRVVATATLETPAAPDAPGVAVDGVPVPVAAVEVPGSGPDTVRAGDAPEAAVEAGPFVDEPEIPADGSAAAATARIAAFVAESGLDAPPSGEPPVVKPAAGLTTEATVAGKVATPCGTGYNGPDGPVAPTAGPGGLVAPTAGLAPVDTVTPGTVAPDADADATA